MVAEVLAGIALAKAAVGGIKSAIDTAKDVNDVAHFVDDLFKSHDQSRQAAKKAQKNKKGDKKWRDYLSTKLKDGDEDVSMSDTIAEVIEQKQIEEAMEHTARLLNKRFGPNTWNEILDLREQRIKELKEKRKKAKEKREEAALQKDLGYEDTYDKILKAMWQVPVVLGFVIGMWWFISWASDGRLSFLWQEIIVAKYQVGIYNKWVRDRVRAGDDPPKGIDPAWEEVYYFDTEAINEEQAKEKMLHQYPTAQGFVIEGVEKYLSSQFN